MPPSNYSMARPHVLQDSLMFHLTPFVYSSCYLFIHLPTRSTGHATTPQMCRWFRCTDDLPVCINNSWTFLVSIRIQPGNNNNTNANALAPVAEQDENPMPMSPREPMVDNVGGEQGVMGVPARPEAMDGPFPQAEMDQHISTDAIRMDAFASAEVGDTTTQLAAENVLSEEDMRREPTEVYMPRGVMEDIHSKSNLFNLIATCSGRMLYFPGDEPSAMLLVTLSFRAFCKHPNWNK